MSDAEVSALVRMRLRTMRIIHLALVTGCLFFAGIAIYVRSQPGAAVPEQPVVGFTGLAFAAVMGVMAFVVPPLIAANWRQKIARGIDTLSTTRPPRSVLEQGGPVAAPAREDGPPERSARWWGLYQMHLIITAALLEGVIFMQLIAYLLEGSTWSLGIAGLFIAALVLLFPTRERIERWIRTQQDLVEQAKRG